MLTPAAAAVSRMMASSPSTVSGGNRNVLQRRLHVASNFSSSACAKRQLPHNQLTRTPLRLSPAHVSRRSPAERNIGPSLLNLISFFPRIPALNFNGQPWRSRSLRSRKGEVPPHAAVPAQSHCCTAHRVCIFVTQWPTAVRVADLRQHRHVLA
jgi:hypothetical protein